MITRVAKKILRDECGINEFLPIAEIENHKYIDHINIYRHRYPNLLLGLIIYDGQKQSSDPLATLVRNRSKTKRNISFGIVPLSADVLKKEASVQQLSSVVGTQSLVQNHYDDINSKRQVKAPPLHKGNKEQCCDPGLFTSYGISQQTLINVADYNDLIDSDVTFLRCINNGNGISVIGKEHFLRMKDFSAFERFVKRFFANKGYDLDIQVQRTYVKFASAIWHNATVFNTVLGLYLAIKDANPGVPIAYEDIYPLLRENVSCGNQMFYELMHKQWNNDDDDHYRAFINSFPVEFPWVRNKGKQYTMVNTINRGLLNRYKEILLLGGE